MRTKIEILPNGFPLAGETVREIEFRKLDGDDEELILDKSELRKGNVLDRFLKRAIVRLGNATDPKVIERTYDMHFLLADTHFALVQLRKWGISPVYRFEIKCPYCDKIGNHRIDLNSLHLDEQPEACRGRDKFVDTIMVDDEEPFVIEHRPLLVRDQGTKEMIKEQYPKEKATRELLIQLLKIGDVPATPAVVKKLSMPVRNAIRNVMDSKVGGIDTRLLMDCSKCERTFSDNMPIDAASFFFQKGDLSKASEARPFRDSGTTSKSSPSTSDGNQVKSDDSALRSESST